MKGFDILMDAYESADLKSCKLVIAGGVDHYLAYSRRLLKRASKNQNIILCGVLNVRQLAQLYGNTALFILASNYEGLPIALLEAMSLGASCIASDIAGNRNVPLAGDRFFEAGNRERLTQMIKRYHNRNIGDQEKQAQIDSIREK